MTNKEAIAELNTFKIGAKSELGKNALDMAIKVLEQELCEDYISRKEVNAIIHNALFDYAGRDAAYGALAKVRKQINDLQ